MDGFVELGAGDGNCRLPGVMGTLARREDGSFAVTLSEPCRTPDGKVYVAFVATKDYPGQAGQRVEVGAYVDPETLKPEFFIMGSVADFGLTGDQVAKLQSFAASGAVRGRRQKKARVPSGSPTTLVVPLATEAAVVSGVAAVSAPVSAPTPAPAPRPCAPVLFWGTVAESDEEALTVSVETPLDLGVKTVLVPWGKVLSGATIGVGYRVWFFARIDGDSVVVDRVRNWYAPVAVAPVLAAVQPEPADVVAAPTLGRSLQGIVWWVNPEGSVAALWLLNKGRPHLSVSYLARGELSPVGLANLEPGDVVTFDLVLKDDKKVAANVTFLRKQAPHEAKVSYISLPNNQGRRWGLARFNEPILGLDLVYLSHGQLEDTGVGTDDRVVVTAIIPPENRSASSTRWRVVGVEKVAAEEVPVTVEPVPASADVPANGGEPLVEPISPDAPSVDNGDGNEPAAVSAVGEPAVVTV